MMVGLKLLNRVLNLFVANFLYISYVIIGFFFLLVLAKYSSITPEMLIVSGLLIVLAFLIRLQFITIRKEKAKLNQIAAYQHIIKNSAYFARIDLNFNIIEMNAGFSKIFNPNSSNKINKTFFSMLEDKLNNSTVQEIKQQIDQYSSYEGVLKLNHNGENLYLNTLICTLNSHENKPIEYLVSCRDFTSFMKLKDKIKNSLFTDQLTNLPNRLKLLQQMQTIYTNPNRDEATIIYINMDSFDEMSEFFGIEIGNRMLNHTASWLKKNLPCKDSYLYKFELNNFVILIPSNFDEEELHKYLKLISSDITKERFSSKTYDIDLNISFTIGAARAKNDVVKYAHLALKEAQKQKKSYVIYNQDQKSEENFLHNIQVNQMIKKAIDNDKIVPFFQPIQNIKTGKIEKFESLIRIQNSDKSYQRPHDFLEIAKKSKLYSKLTKAMIKISFDMLETINHPITINLNVDDMLNRGVSDFIFRQLAKLEDASFITFEIVESEEIENYTRVSNFIKKAKQYGCKFAIDDFGSGYSSFEQVLNLDIDYLKIDGSLIKNIHKNRASETAIKSIVTFSKTLGIKTIAEFVSSQAIFDKVKELGVDYAQGYHIGKPTPLAV